MAVSYKRHILTTLLMSALTLGASAQAATPLSVHPTDTLTVISDTPISDTPLESLESKKSGKSLFDNLDLEFTLGTTGIGFNASTRLTDMVRLRAGLSVHPHTNVPMAFDLMAYGGEDSDPETAGTRFDKMAELMKEFTGMTVDQQVDMKAHPTMSDFRLLVDVYPFANNRHWYVTGGFYWGNSRIGHVENTIQEAPTVMGVVMYNNLYDYFISERFFDEPIYGSVYMDPVIGLEMKDKFQSMGRLGAHVGDFKPGTPMYHEGETTPYMLRPDENGTIYADMYVNHFKPYLGVGYETTLGRDGRWSVGFDAGALFWGKPKILTHEYYIYNEDGTVTYGYVNDPEFGGTIGRQINLAEDVTDISGKVGTYCDIAKTMHLFPVLNFRLTYKLF